jgi:hypothetical protein
MDEVTHRQNSEYLFPSDLSSCYGDSNSLSIASPSFHRYFILPQSPPDKYICLAALPASSPLYSSQAINTMPSPLHHVVTESLQYGCMCFALVNRTTLCFHPPALPVSSASSTQIPSFQLSNAETTREVFSFLLDNEINRANHYVLRHHLCPSSGPRRPSS